MQWGAYTRTASHKFTSNLGKEETLLFVLAGLSSMLVNWIFSSDDSLSGCIEKTVLLSLRQ